MTGITGTIIEDSFKYANIILRIRITCILEFRIIFKK